MTHRPSTSTLERLDALWDAAPPAADGDPPSRSHRRSPRTTNPWDDRTFPLLGVAGTAAAVAPLEQAPPASPSRVSAVRSGTGSWDDLLPAGVKHRHEGLAAAAARAARPVRGGTLSWDELVAAMHAEHPISSVLHDAVRDAAEQDPFEDLATDSLGGTPDGEPTR